VTWSKASSGGDDGALAPLAMAPHLRGPFGAALADLGRFLVTDHDEGRVHENCLRAVAQLFDYRLACLLVLNPAGEPEVHCTLPPDGAARKLHVSRSLVDVVLRERRALLLDAKALKLGNGTPCDGICSALVVPLFDNDDLLGVIYLDQNNPSRAFAERHLQRLQLLSNLVAAKLRQARTHSEMAAAGYIQRSMLCNRPQPPAGYELAFRLEPSIHVGGDFYETLPLPDGRHLLALGDVAGHGVGAALLMANMLATLRALAPRATSPLDLVHQLGALLTETLRPHGFVTLFLGFLDPTGHTLEYVSAGHEFPALFVPGLPASAVDSTGMPLGIPEPPVALQAATLALPPGALLCAWSDGIPEALRRTMQPPVEFSRERLLSQLHGLRQEPPEEIVRRVFAEVDSFMDSPHAHDDRTLLVLRRSSA
jgi:serine phosphatase RsbU (regulator of sigma subunit)